MSHTWEAYDPIPYIFFLTKKNKKKQNGGSQSISPFGLTLSLYIRIQIRK